MADRQAGVAQQPCTQAASLCQALPRSLYSSAEEHNGQMLSLARVLIGCSPLPQPSSLICECQDTLESKRAWDQEPWGSLVVQEAWVSQEGLKEARG